MNISKPISKTTVTEMNTFVYGQLILNKGTKTIQRGNNILFNKWCWEK